MKTRVISSALVVFVGLAPALIGGPAFALLMIGLGAAGYREYLDLAARVNPGAIGSYHLFGYAVVIALGLAALLDATATTLFAVATLATAAPLVRLFSSAMHPGAFSGWSLASSGSLYLGLPVYAAVAIRSSPGTIDATWLSDLAGRLSFGWESAPRGLAWALTAILATWVGDSAAYLAGGSRGKRKLAQSISPNKTVEGAVGGLAGSMAVGAVAFQSFGLGQWWLGLAAGGVIGLAGQIGDLAESVLKRQAGVKDSGATIPGHGGVLDRIDALLFAFPAGLLLAAGFERIGA